MSGSVELAFDDYGKPDGRPVVLLHALGRSAADWVEVAAGLASDFRVIVPDLRGHGRSPRPGTYSFALMRDDVCALLDRLRVTRVSLVGHSMGGTVAYLV